jgi:hypothetical protein
MVSAYSNLRHTVLLHQTVPYEGPNKLGKVVTEVIYHLSIWTRKWPFRVCSACRLLRYITDTAVLKTENMWGFRTISYFTIHKMIVFWGELNIADIVPPKMTCISKANDWSSLSLKRNYTSDRKVFPFPVVATRTELLFLSFSSVKSV